MFGKTALSADQIANLEDCARTLRSFITLDFLRSDVELDDDPRIDVTIGPYEAVPENTAWHIKNDEDLSQVTYEVTLFGPLNRYSEGSYRQSDAAKLSVMENGLAIVYDPDTIIRSFGCMTVSQEPPDQNADRLNLFATATIAGPPPGAWY
jgi:hypothetical protein